MKLILRCTLAIFSAYRVDSYGSDEHAEGYKANLKAVLAQYPDDVIAHVGDPRTGVQRSHNWPPTIAQIVTACEVHRDFLARIEQHKNRGKKVMAERKQLEAPRDDRPTLEELKAKYGPNWGLTPEPKRPPPQRAPSSDEIRMIYEANPGRLAKLFKRDTDVEPT
jgi:hypothetical protein